MSFEGAVKVKGIPEEHAYIAREHCNCGGAWRWMQQALLFSPQQVPHDRISVQCDKCGETREYLFDVSGFFGVT